ncbi:MAG: DUF1877 family protein [Chitinophagaceae bacterium]|nr:MAG: DUF1877 family protein [Chitinophagaceae bacterium]
MSQSATLYRITTEQFHLIERMETRHVKPTELTDAYVTFHGTFMGLEAVLSKGLDRDSQELLVEIFNPVHYIGPADSNVFPSEEEEEYWEQDESVGYLPVKKVKKVDAMLRSIDPDAVANNYNAAELNEDQVYPGSWENGNTTDVAFNTRRLLEDFRSLQNFFRDAAENENYVLSYVG